MEQLKIRAFETASKTMLTWNCLCQTAFNCQSVADQHKATSQFMPLLISELEKLP